jgi:hypothetical protein
MENLHDNSNWVHIHLLIRKFFFFSILNLFILLCSLPQTVHVRLGYLRGMYDSTISSMPLPLINPGQKWRSPKATRNHRIHLFCALLGSNLRSLERESVCALNNKHGSDEEHHHRHASHLRFCF